jgi:hypothetical protein
VITLVVLVLLFAALGLAAARWGADTRTSGQWRWAHETGSAATRAVGRAWADQVELQERLALLNRPWEEEFLHWVGEGPDRRLHGTLPPPRTGRRHSVTARGWCPSASSRP